MGWLLAQTIDPAQPTPAELAREAELDAIQRRAQRAARARVREVEAAQRPAVDPAEIRRLIAASDDEIEARRAAQRAR